MSLSKLFQRIIWHNNTTPAINEDNLNAMSKAIDDIDDRVILIGDDVVTVIPQIQAYLEQAESIVEAVEELSQNPPYIGANGNWYVFDTTLEAYKDSGVDASITVDIADITMIAEGAQPYVTNTGTNTDPVFHLFLPRSPQGATGNGIANIAKTGTQGLVDTYTITMTDGTTYTFTVTNGQDGQGSGDMTKAVYDSTNAVADAGGIVAYVAAHSGAGTLAGLDDVTLSSLTAGDTLVYNATTQKWENSTVIQTLTNQVTALLDNTEINGAVNLLANNFTTRVVSGITHTVNADGTVTSSGTATANNNTNSVFSLKKGTYRLSGCPSGGSDSTYRLTINNHTTSTNLAMDKGDGAIFTISEDIEAIVYCDVRSGFSGTVTFKPMITVPSYNGDYVPYAKSNRELTDDVTLKKYTMEITNMSSVTTKSISKSGNVKFFNLSGQNSTGYDAGTSYQLTVLPSDFLPSAYFSKEIMLRNGVQSFFEIAANGTVRIVPRTAVTANAGISIAETFI